jgi:hypothetical protein
MYRKYIWVSLERNDDELIIGAESSAIIVEEISIIAFYREEMFKIVIKLNVFD